MFKHQLIHENMLHNLEILSSGANSKVNVIAIGGTGGGLHGPGYLYEYLMRHPMENCIFTRLDIACGGTPSDRFRHSMELLIKAIEFVYKLTQKPIVLMGWSFGGAVVIETAYRLQSLMPIVGVITIATDLARRENVGKLRKEMLKVFIHGDQDTVMASSFPQNLFPVAGPMMLSEEYELYCTVTNPLQAYFQLTSCSSSTSSTNSVDDDSTMTTTTTMSAATVTSYASSLSSDFTDGETSSTVGDYNGCATKKAAQHTTTTRKK